MNVDAAAAWVIDGIASGVAVTLVVSLPLLLLFLAFGSVPRK